MSSGGRPSRAVRAVFAFVAGLVLGVPFAGAAVSSSPFEPTRGLELPDVGPMVARLPEMPEPNLSSIAPIRPRPEAVAPKAKPRTEPVAVEREPKSEIDRLILEFASRFGVEPALVKAVIHAESRFNPKAKSHRGAVGLMQLMPRTASMYGVSRLTDPRENIRAGVQHLKRLLGRHQKLTHVIAAYNAGSPTVRRYRGIPPYRETQTYVTRVLRYRGQYLTDPLFAPVAAPKPAPAPAEPEKPFFESAREDIGTRG